MTLFADLVRTSARVAENPGRLVKIRELADYLEHLDANELDVAIPYLSGEARQGKLSIGYGMLMSSKRHPSAEAALALADVDAAFQALRDSKGKGAAARREQVLRALSERAVAAPYEAGSRGATWLKVKKAHTLDLVVLAAEWGHGRRKVGYPTCTSARATREAAPT